MALAPEQAAIGIRRRFTTEGVHPYDLVEWERRDARITNYRDGAVAFEQTDVEFPVDWSLNATNIVAQKYFRGTIGTPEREWSLKQVADRVANTITEWGLRDGYFVDEREAARVQRRAQVPDRHPTRRVQLAGLVQHRREGRASAGLGVLHPGRRRHDGLDPQLVHRRRHDLQGWLGCGREPQPHPFEPGAVEGRRHRVRPGELHAWRRRLGRHDQVRWQDAACRQDGHPQRRSSRHRRVHLVQGARREEGACARGRGLRHDARRQGHHVGPVPERQQLGAGHRRVHAGGRRRRRLAPSGRHHR